MDTLSFHLQGQSLWEDFGCLQFFCHLTDEQIGNDISVVDVGGESQDHVATEIAKQINTTKQHWSKGRAMTFACPPGYPTSDHFTLVLRPTNSFDLYGGKCAVSQIENHDGTTELTSMKDSITRPLSKLKCNYPITSRGTVYYLPDSKVYDTTWAFNDTHRANVLEFPHLGFIIWLL